MDAKPNQAEPVGTSEAKAMMQADWLFLHKENQRLVEVVERSRGYTIALQRSIEYASKGKQIPEEISIQCPHHSSMLNARNNQLENELAHCLSIIDTNLECGNDLRIKYAKTLLR